MTDRGVLSLPRRAVRDVRTRLRERGRKAFLRALRLTTTAVASYAAALQLSSSARPLLAPLTAMLVVQVSLYGTLRSGWQRVLSVVAGVLLAVGFSSVTGLTWWSLGILIGASIIVGQLLRLGDHLLEVPISAMLVLAVGNVESAAEARIFETLIGAAVGVGMNAIWPPPVQNRSAGAAVERFAQDIAELLEQAAEALHGQVSVDQAARWLDDARRLTGRVSRYDRVLREADESRRLNVRAYGTADPGPHLRRGLDALERAAVALRNLFRGILDGVRARPEVGQAEDSELRPAFAVLLEDVATAIRAYGRMVHCEAESDEPADDELAEALEALREARARVTELLLVDPREEPDLWALNGTMLATIERVLGELDLEEHRRARERSREEPPWRLSVPAMLTGERLRTTRRHLVGRRPQR